MNTARVADRPVHVTRSTTTEEASIHYRTTDKQRRHAVASLDASLILGLHSFTACSVLAIMKYQQFTAATVVSLWLAGMTAFQTSLLPIVVFPSSSLRLISTIQSTCHCRRLSRGHHYLHSYEQNGQMSGEGENCPTTSGRSV